MGLGEQSAAGQGALAEQGAERGGGGVTPINAGSGGAAGPEAAPAELDLSDPVGRQQPGPDLARMGPRTQRGPGARLGVSVRCLRAQDSEQKE